ARSLRTRHCAPWPHAAAATRPQADGGGPWGFLLQPPGTASSPVCTASSRVKPGARTAPGRGQHKLGTAEYAEHEYFTERIAETRDSPFSAPKVIKSSLRTCPCNNRPSPAKRRATPERLRWRMVQKSV